MNTLRIFFILTYLLFLFPAYAETDSAPWSNSQLNLRNTINSQSILPWTTLSWQPRLTTAIDLQPVWVLNESISFSSAFSLVSEFRNWNRVASYEYNESSSQFTAVAETSSEYEGGADASYNQVYISDLTLSCNVSDLYTIPYVDVDMALTGSVVLPTNKMSRNYYSKIIGFIAGINLSREFFWYKKITTHYYFGFNKSFFSNHYTAASHYNESADEMFLSGEQNPYWGMSQRFSFSTKLVENLSLRAGLGFSYSFIDSYKNTEDSFLAETSTGVRYTVSENIALITELWPHINLIAGLYAAHPQLGLKGTYMQPLNRDFTNYLSVFFNLNFKLGNLISEYLKEGNQNGS